jgi:16S rRNA (guanine(527)-N(7))-methyltransferase RsmG
MLSARIPELLAPFLEAPLAPTQLDQVSTYLDLLLHWNARINLTAIRTPEEIITRHFGESFFLARHLFPTGPVRTAPGGFPDITRQMASLATHHYSGTTVLDIGSGAGFPALPLKIFAPEIHLTLIEANHKKSAFLREVIRALAFSNATVITGRAENLLAECTPTGAREAESLEPQPRPQGGHNEGVSYDLVTFRAVEKFDSILPLAYAFLSQNGILALLIGSTQLLALRTLPNVSWNAPIHVPKSYKRVLSIGRRSSQ